jgi:DNA-binding transcriptional regulator YhcF (GntR family)
MGNRATAFMAYYRTNTILVGMTWKTPSQDRAATFLDALLRQARTQRRRHLPSVKKLSADAGVSYVTMWKALRRLRDRAVIVMQPGKRSHLTSSTESILTVHPPDESLPAAPRQKWRQLVSTVEQDVLRGVYPPGTHLPSAKELMARYGVCQPTLRKALTVLVDKGCIRRHGRSYQAPLLSSAHARAKVVLIARTDDLPGGGSLHLRPRVDDHLRALEHECTMAGLGLDMVPFTFSSGRQMSLANRLCAALDAPAGAYAIGFVIFATSIPSANVVELTGRLVRRGKAVAILDEQGQVALPAGLTGSDLVGHYTMAITPLCGRDMGRYLLSLGHRRVAYFSSDFGAADRRLQGLREAFEAAGLPDAVRRFAVEREDMVANALPSRVARSVDSLMARTFSRTGRYRTLYARTDAALRLLVSATMLTEATFDRLIPLFDKALVFADITAWVGHNDQAALRALDYLKYRKRAVPREIAVVGFDDSPEALSEKLTSYNFNSVSVMHAMVAHVLDPRSPHSGIKGSGPREIPGFIAERGTTARR